MSFLLGPLKTLNFYHFSLSLPFVFHFFWINFSIKIRFFVALSKSLYFFFFFLKMRQATNNFLYYFVFLKKEREREKLIHIFSSFFLAFMLQIFFSLCNSIIFPFLNIFFDFSSLSYYDAPHALSSSQSLIYFLFFWGGGIENREEINYYAPFFFLDYNLMLSPLFMLKPVFFPLKNPTILEKK